MNPLAFLSSILRGGQKPVAAAPKPNAQVARSDAAQSTGVYMPYLEACRTSPDRSQLPAYNTGLARLLLPMASSVDAFQRDMAAGLGRYAIDNWGAAFYAVDLAANYSAPATPRAATPDRDWNKLADSLWDEASKTLEFTGRFDWENLCRVASIAIDADGDVGVSAEGVDGQMKLKLWPGWRIGSALAGVRSLPGEYDGVMLDKSERIVGYRVLVGPNATDFANYDANQFTLLLDRDVTDRYRGLSALRRGMNDIRDSIDIKGLDKLKVKISAALAAVIENGSPFRQKDWEDPDAATNPTPPVSTGETPKSVAVASLLGGEIPVIEGSLKQLSTGAGSNQSEFVDKLNGWFVSGMGIPPALFNDEKLTGPNLRAVIAKAQRKFNTRKRTMIALARWVWVRFIAQAIAAGQLPENADWRRVIVHTPPDFGIDLGDQEAADAEAVKTGRMSRQAYWGKRGTDWEPEVDQIFAEDRVIFDKASKLASETGVPIETILMRHGYQFMKPSPGEGDGSMLGGGGIATGKPVSYVADPLAYSPDQRREKGRFAYEGKGGKNGGPGNLTKAAKAKKGYKPNTELKNAATNRAAELVAKMTGGEATRLNAPFDVLTSRAGIEIKGVFDNGNAKLTMHSPEAHDPVGSLNRKILWVRANGKSAVTIGFAAPKLKGFDKKYPGDFKQRIARMDGSDWIWYVRDGVGSFRLHKMTKLKGVGELKAWMRDNAAKISETGKAIAGRQVALWAGLTRGKELESHLAKVKAVKSKEELTKIAKQVADEQVRRGRARRTNKGLKPVVDWNGKPIVGKE